jgi:hypothetical protein
VHLERPRVHLHSRRSLKPNLLLASVHLPDPPHSASNPLNNNLRQQAGSVNRLRHSDSLPKPHHRLAKPHSSSNRRQLVPLGNRLPQSIRLTPLLLSSSPGPQPLVNLPAHRAFLFKMSMLALGHS